RRRPDRSRRRRPRRPRSRGPGMTAQRPAAPNAQQPGLAADVPQTPRSEVSKGERAIPLFHRCDNAITHPDWRPLEYAIHAWTRAHGGSELLARVAAETSLAESLGHTALYPAEALGLDAEALQSLRAQPRHVGTGEGGPPTPFVLDAASRFYFWRNHANERALATAIQARRRAGHPIAVPEEDVDALFNADRSDAVQGQRAAVRNVAGRRLFVLTGGPGTGKTTTVLRMLLMLQRHAPAPLRVRAAAPTGKAAQRLLQALRTGREALLATPLPQPWRTHADCIPQDGAVTLPRLLELH